MSVSVPPSLEYLGYGRWATLNAAKAIATDTPTTGVVLPDTCNYALMTVLTQDAVVTEDGTTTPTATVGFRYPKSQVYKFENARARLKNLSLIEQAASAEVIFAWYRGAS